MAKTRTTNSTSKRHRKEKDALRRNAAPVHKPLKQISSFDGKSTDDLLTEATNLLEQSRPDLAIPIVEEALRQLEAEKQTQYTGHNSTEATVPAVLVLAGETHMSVGNTLQAKSHFKRSTDLDPNGSIVSADPWLWLAQLSDTGGHDSIEHYSRATEILRREIGVLQDQVTPGNDLEQLLVDKQVRLGEALCSMTEVYMTDLSWEQDAEQRCEAFVTEALAVVPEEKSASALQCLANVRISQERRDEAREALRKSLEIWRDDEDKMPDFASRISLSRLLMEVDMLDEAMAIVHSLVQEDDQSVEAWYLGGWCRILKPSMMKSGGDITTIQQGARQWLKTCLRLYQTQSYEDERLQAHARDLLDELDESLGPEPEADDEEWDDEVSSDGAEDEDDLEEQVNGSEERYENDAMQE